VKVSSRSSSTRRHPCLWARSSKSGLPRRGGCWSGGPARGASSTLFGERVGSPELRGHWRHVAQDVAHHPDKPAVA
jgi:hypothetical protein